MEYVKINIKRGGDDDNVGLHVLGCQVDILWKNCNSEVVVGVSPFTHHGYVTSDAFERNCLGLTTNPNAKHWFTTSFLQEEGAGERCSECATNPNSKH